MAFVKVGCPRGLLINRLRFSSLRFGRFLKADVAAAIALLDICNQITCA